MRTLFRKISCFSILSFLLISIIFGNVFAETDDNDNKLKFLIVETQKSSDTTFIWWLPQEYWKASAEAYAGSRLTEAMEIYSEYFRPYIVMLVAHVKPSSTRPKFISEADLLAHIRLIDEHGYSHFPLTPKQINPNFRKFLKEIKPHFTESFGTLGKHMSFVIFAAEDNDGLVVDTSKESQFKIKIANEEFIWKLPFESLIPPQECRTCHKRLNGKYKFCPWDGTSLK